MPGEVTNHGEKPIHYTYLKEFRTQQCPDFLQHKCAHHRPYTCFNWHFLNQKRRRPIRKKDGSFNYSPDIYCSKYDETSGICPDGDECPLLHRIAGDVERRYHLRYFKTCPCVYETDSRGQCSKNGPHCAFAHGMDDLRQPVYDCHDLERMLDGQKAADDGSSDLLSSSLEKDMLYNEDPVWNDPNYVLAHYKTEVCRRPHRLCRQGYACPSFHNSRDKRRSPKTHKYRSTPCPNVKHGDEWGDPPQCENGDSCTYCHTRTEQQFHPEIYKSTKCNDMMQTGYCPRGQFCAFAHIEKELNAQWDVFSAGETSLAEYVENVLPLSDQTTNSSEHGDLPGGKMDEKDKLNGCRKLSADAVANCASIWQSSNSPGLNPLPEPIGKRRTVSLSEGTPLNQFKLHASEKEERQALMKHHIQMLDSRLTIDTNDAINMSGRTGHPLLNNFIANNSGNFPGIGSTPSTPLSSNMSPHATPFYPGEDTVESVIVNALDEELGLGGLNLSSYDKDNEDSNSVCSSLSASFPSFGSYFGSHSVPMSIPAATDYQLASSFGGSFGQSLDTTSFGSFSLTTLGSLHSQQSKLEQMLLKRPSGSSLFGDVGPGSYPGYGSSSGAMQGASAAGFKPGTSTQTNQGDVQRLREELAMNQMKLAKWEEGIQQARHACEAWRKEMEDSNNRAKKADEERQMAIKQRDEALTLANALKQELELLKRGPLMHCLQGMGEVDRLSEQSLQALQSQLRRDLETVEKKLSSLHCIMCDKPNANLAALPCNHNMCHVCIQRARKCPLCQADVSRGAEAHGTM